jgi:hypothetical protein
MTGLLETALRRVESLSAEEQDAIASQIIETLDDEEAWARSFAQIPPRCEPWRVRRLKSTVEATRVPSTN